MADDPERAAQDPGSATGRTSLVFLREELDAMKWLIETNPKYNSMPDVLRDYSLNDLVEFHRRALEGAGASS